MRLCLAGDNDNISNFVRFFGRFYDCDDVEIAVVERNATSYLNIGSNIGVCVAAVGTHFDVVVSAIEPLQRNFFYLSQTAKLLPTYTNIHNFGLSSTFTYDHLFPDTDFDVVSLHYKSEACEIVCGALVSITRGKWKYLQTEMNYAKPKNNVCDKRTYMTILENLGFVQTGKGTVYPFLSYVITLTESYYYEWHGAIDSKVILASEICRKLLP